MATPSQGRGHVQGAREPQEDQDKLSARCECGNLLAMIVEDGVEIKCRRCKRLVIIPAEVDPKYLQMLEDQEAKRRR